MFDATKVKAKTWALVLIFVVAVFAALAVLMSDTEKQEAAEMNPQLPAQEVASGVAPKTGGSANQTQTYTNLVKEYEGKRIQFDIGCQANPGQATFKTGTKVMFDNRSGDPRIITIGGVQYSFAGYGYKILTLSSPSLPKTILLSCGAAVNVGQILLQK